MSLAYGEGGIAKDGIANSRPLCNMCMYVECKCDMNGWDRTDIDCASHCFLPTTVRSFFTFQTDPDRIELLDHRGLSEQLVYDGPRPPSLTQTLALWGRCLVVLAVYSKVLEWSKYAASGSGVPSNLRQAPWQPEWSMLVCPFSPSNSSGVVERPEDLKAIWPALRFNEPDLTLRRKSKRS